MKDYRGIIQNVIETAEQMNVRGSTDAQRLCTIVYTLSALQNEMTKEMEAEAAQAVRAAVEVGTEKTSGREAESIEQHGKHYEAGQPDTAAERS